MSDKRTRRKLRSLYEKQDHLCYWCGCEMLPPGQPYVKRARPDPKLCTYDLRYDKFDERRGKERSVNVGACWQCNFNRGSDSMASMPKWFIRAKSSRYHRS